MGKLLKTLILHAKSSRAIKDASLLLILQMVTQANNLIATLAVTRYLGPTNMGIMAFTQTFVGFTFLLNAGLDNYYLWEMATSPEKRKSIISRGLSAKIITNSISLSIGLVILFFLNASSREIIIIIAALFVAMISSSVGFLASFLLMEKKVSKYFTAAMYTTFSIITLRLVGVYFKFPVEYFTGVLIGETLIFITYLRILGFVQIKELQLLKENFFSNTTKELHSARYYIGIVFASLLFARADQFFIKEFLTTADLGLYSASVRLAELPMVLITVLTSVIVPRITIANGETNRSRIALISAVFFAGTGVALMLLFIFFGDIFIHIVYGSQFLAAAPVLAIYALGLPGLWVNSFANLMFSSYQRVHFALYIAMAGGVISITLLSILVPHYGLIGAAASVATTYTIMGILSLGIGFTFRHKFLARKLDPDLILPPQKEGVLFNNPRE